jgi:hypothetical protein
MRCRVRRGNAVAVITDKERRASVYRNALTAFLESRGKMEA